MAEKWLYSRHPQVGAHGRYVIIVISMIPPLLIRCGCSTRSAQGETQQREVC
jgi:hypothetical protein